MQTELLISDVEFGYSKCIIYETFTTKVNGIEYCLYCHRYRDYDLPDYPKYRYYVSGFQIFVLNEEQQNVFNELRKYFKKFHNIKD